MNKELLKQETSKSLFEAIDKINDAMLGIDIKVKAINDKLDELIKALHDYDGDYDSNEEYGESSFEAFQDEAELNKRMDIIGQNGNEGSHYGDYQPIDDVKDKDEFDDYGQRVVKDRGIVVGYNFDNDNEYPGKLGRGEMTVGGEDKDKDNKNVGGNKKKYNNKYRRQPNTPVTPKKMSVVEHEKYPPHKH